MIYISSHIKYKFLKIQKVLFSGHPVLSMNIMYPMKCMVYLCADVVYVSSLTGSKKSNTIVNFYPAKYVHAMVD